MQHAGVHHHLRLYADADADADADACARGAPPFLHLRCALSVRNFRAASDVVCVCRLETLLQPPVLLQPPELLQPPLLHHLGWSCTGAAAAEGRRVRKEGCVSICTFVLVKHVN